MRHFYLSILLAVLSCIAGTNAWAYDFVADGIYYNITSAEDLTVEVTYRTSSDYSYSGDVVIPATVEYDSKTYSVTGIGDSAFYRCTAVLTSIEIPSGVTSIGNYAFYWCNGLTSIEIPGGVTSIGNCAFQWCTGLTSIEIPGSETSIGNYAFYECTKLTRVVIGEGVTSIGNYAFQSLRQLESITLPSTITSMGYMVFSYCTGTVYINGVLPETTSSYSSSTSSIFWRAWFDKVVFKEGVPRISGHLFGGANDDNNYLKEVSIPSSVKSIGEQAFARCKALETIEIPAGVDSIEASAFSGTGLTDVIVPNTVTSISSGAFSSCPLRTITIPSSVTSLGMAFYGSTGTAYINCEIPDGTSNYGYDATFYNSKFSEVVIGEGVKKIGDYAFYGCNDLQNIVFSASVDSIGKKAFYYCNGLTDVVIPATVKSIGNSAFYGCKGLTKLTLQDGLSNVAGPYAFCGCTALTDVVIPASVDTVGDHAFFYCTSLANITIQEGVSYLGTNAFSGCTALSEVTIPSSITGMGEQVFKDCTGTAYVNCDIPEKETGAYYSPFAYSKFRKVVLGDNVTRIGEDGFVGNDSLITVEIPSSVTYIGARAFYGCKKLQNIELPPYIERIENNTFYSCDSLGVLFIPEGVKSIGRQAFRLSSAKEIIIPSSVTSIEYEAFSGCKSPKVRVNCEMPDATDNFGETGAFFGSFSDGCEVEVEIGDSVTYIGKSTFRKSKLASVTIAGSVKTIGSYAFYQCTGLTRIYVNSLTPPETGYQVFEGVDKEKCVLYVPAGSEEDYKNSATWKDFFNVAVNPYVTVEKKAVIYVVDGEEYHRDSVAVTLPITAIAVPTREGYTFSGWSEIPATMPDNDVTVTGTFTINKYAVIYMVDGEEYRRDSVEYGATIILAENPTRESHDFSGWSGYPENLIMPAGDVTITGAFTVNGLAGVGAAAIVDEYFDLTGKPLAQPQRGINLVRKADGTTRKIIVK